MQGEDTEDEMQDQMDEDFFDAIEAEDEFEEEEEEIYDDKISGVHGPADKSQISTNLAE
jgi:hypothetical protein